jgi:imidazolonepropionase-like amidohydrolase
MTVVFKNARVFDGTSRQLKDGLSVVIRDDVIREITPEPVGLMDARVIDCVGKTLMPGLIDAHVHVVANKVDLKHRLNHEGRRVLQESLDRRIARAPAHRAIKKCRSLPRWVVWIADASRDRRPIVDRTRSANVEADRQSRGG